MASGAHYPYEAPIEAYGSGGFRFAGMSHRGSILCMPTGVHAWAETDAALLSPASFALVLETLKPPSFLLLGTGRAQSFPSAAIRAAFSAAGIGLDAMDTGAAARTYNVLLAEKRPVAAALIAVS
jgi:uncharacterized protein